MSFKRGLLITFGRTGTTFAIQFASNVIIARLLLPSEIGIFSVAIAVTALLHALRDFGVGKYLIQESNLTQSKIQTVFGVALLVSWTMGATLFLGRELAASFYEEPQISGILALLSLNFISLPFGQPAFVLLRREMRYGQLAIVTLSSTMAGAIVSIAAAAMGAGPFALAYGALANSVTTVVLSLGFRPQHILLRPSLKEWRSICRFGGVASSATIVTNLGMQAPELILGRLLGFAAVGFYSRGVGLASAFEQLFVNAVNWVTGPMIGSLRRERRDPAEFIVKATDLCAVVGWPALIFLALKAEAVIWLLFGESWLPAAPVLQALCAARAVGLLASQAAAAYEGTGAVGLQLRNELVIQAVSVALLLVAAQHGLTAVAWSRVPLLMIAVVVHFSVYRRYAELTVIGMLTQLWRSVVVAVAFLAVMLGLIALEPQGVEDNPLILLGESLVMGTIFTVLLFATRHSLHAHLSNAVRGILRRVPC